MTVTLIPLQFLKSFASWSTCHCRSSIGHASTVDSWLGSSKPSCGIYGSPSHIQRHHARLDSGDISSTLYFFRGHIISGTVTGYPMTQRVNGAFWSEAG